MNKEYIIKFECKERDKHFEQTYTKIVIANNAIHAVRRMEDRYDKFKLLDIKQI